MRKQATSLSRFLRQFQGDANTVSIFTAYKGKIEFVDPSHQLVRGATDDELEQGVEEENEYPHIQEVSISERPDLKFEIEAQDEGRNLNLAKDLMEMGYVFVPLEGVYTYQKGFMKGMKAFEKPFWIIDIPYRVAQDLCKKYDQESFIFGKKGNWGLVDTYTEELIASGSDMKFTIDKERAEFYSMWKKRPFVFASQSPLNRLSMK